MTMPSLRVPGDRGEDAAVDARQGEVHDQARYEHGASLRFYDAAHELWQSTWIGPMQAAVSRFTALRAGDSVMLESRPDEASRLCWIFSEIGERSFAWSNSEQAADGPWRLVQDFQARRSA